MPGRKWVSWSTKDSSSDEYVKYDSCGCVSSKKTSKKAAYLSVPKVRREVIAPLPKLERYDLMHFERFSRCRRGTWACSTAKRQASCIISSGVERLPAGGHGMHIQRLMLCWIIGLTFWSRLNLGIEDGEVVRCSRLAVVTCTRRFSAQGI
jgi:hypothetical protein